MGPDATVTPLDAALEARRRGWSVVPLHTARAGRCTCGDAQCPSPAKHPHVAWDEFQRRLPSEDEVRRWWRRWPDANVGVVTGAVSDLVVVDVDPRSGGDDELDELERRFGVLAPTATCRSGGGGTHRYFRHPGRAVASGPVVPGVDLKADGGLVVAPPSVHASGERYRWEPGSSPDERTLAELPAWLADRSHLGDTAGRPDPVFAPRTAEERREFAATWAEVGVELRSGDRYYLCPFHDDHHPSLHVDAEGCRWYCFGCGRGGGPGALLRLAVRRVAHAGRPTPTEVARERVPVPNVPETWMQWPTLRPGGTQDVVGEANYADRLERLAGGRRFGGTRQRWFTARLTREHTNPHDPDAVRVDIGSGPVGYLPRDDAPRFHPVLAQLARVRRPATARARLTGGWERGPGGRGSIGVRLDLDPRLVATLADAPFLPGDAAVPVRVEESRRPAVARILGDADSRRTTATLVPAPDGGVRVKIGDDEVGSLAGPVAARLAPVVARTRDAGFPATCAAVVHARRRGPVVEVYVPGADAL